MGDKDKATPGVAVKGKGKGKGKGKEKKKKKKGDKGDKCDKPTFDPRLKKVNL